MQQYDIATKVLIESCRDEIIRYFTGIEIRESTLVEPLPQETVSLKRSDYPVLITDDKGVKRLIILEIQTFWNRKVPLNLLDYRTRYLIQHDDVEVISCVVLLCPSSKATDCYKDNEVNFTYRLIRIFDLDAQAVVSEGPLCLMPFIPLMKHGKDVLAEADTLIYKSELSRLQKADMLTSMAILSGLISEDMPAKLVSRRKDMMIESAAYQLLKQDGIKEGLQEGLQQGLQQGFFQGLSESLLLLLEVKFGIEGIKLHSKLRDIVDAKQIRSLMEVIRLAKSPQDVLNFVEAGGSS